MISPLKPVEDYTPQFVVADIETWAARVGKNREGDLLAIDTCWRNDFGNLEHEGFRGWYEWFEWIKKQAMNDIRFRCVYAHNGGGFDWVHFTSFLLKQTKDVRWGFDCSCAGSRMVTLTVKCSERLTIHFCDSLQLLRSGLDKLGKKFIGIGKVDTDGKLPHELYLSDKKLFEKYHKQDTETLILVMEKAITVLRENIAKIAGFGMTIGSTAMKVFKTSGIERPISIPWDEQLKAFLREGYRGGRVECFRPGLYKKVFVYDVNSLYPSVMVNTRVPVSSRGSWTDNFLGGECGCYRIKFSQANRSIFPVLMVGGKGVYSGEGVFFSPEIKLLLEVDRGAVVEYLQGYEFLDNEKVFSSFVGNLYKLRLSDRNGALGELCKFLMNSLYGKFGQHPERESVILDETISLREKLMEDEKNFGKGTSTVRIINEKLGVFGVSRLSRCEFEHVGIAGMITSAARVALYRGFMNVGMQDILYCDTDSIHTLVSFPKRLVSNELGSFKLESTGRGVYAGKKLYAIQNNESTKIRAKGVSVGGKNGASLCFDDLCRMVEGSNIACSFHQFPTILEVLQGKKKAGVMYPRKRTLRRV